jgi:hypothetical protein
MGWPPRRSQAFLHGAPVPTMTAWARARSRRSRPDARFRANVVHHSVRFAAGYPACVPGALGDVCAAASRPVRGIVDAALLVPIRPGDHVTAQGAFEVVDGVRIFSAHTLVDHTSPLAPGR